MTRLDRAEDEGGLAFVLESDCLIYLRTFVNLKD